MAPPRGVEGRGGSGAPRARRGWSGLAGSPTLFPRNTRPGAGSAALGPPAAGLGGLGSPRAAPGARVASGPPLLSSGAGSGRGAGGGEPGRAGWARAAGSGPAAGERPEPRASAHRPCPRDPVPRVNVSSGALRRGAVSPRAPHACAPARVNIRAPGAAQCLPPRVSEEGPGVGRGGERTGAAPARGSKVEPR